MFIFKLFGNVSFITLIRLISGVLCTYFFIWHFCKYKHNKSRCTRYTNTNLQHKYFIHIEETQMSIIRLGSTICDWYLKCERNHNRFLQHVTPKVVVSSSTNAWKHLKQIKILGFLACALIVKLLVTFHNYIWNNHLF